MAVLEDTRHKVLAAVLVLVVGYAAVDYFYVQSSGDSSAPDVFNGRAAYEKNVTDSIGRVTKGALNPVALHKVRMAGESLQAIPLYDSAGPFYLAGRQSESFSTQIEGQEVTYSGFIELGGSRLALLNGVEYAEGDEFIIAGYKIAQIEDQFVILLRGAESGLPGARVKVPMAENTEQPVTVRVVE